MITISLCMIVKNEEAVLGRCLDCAKQVADEIIIVDTGSTDHTMELASSFTGHVYTFPWVDDFSAARNFSFSKATCDYIMWLDADDVISSENIAKLQALKQDFPTDVDVGMMKYEIAFDENGTPTFSYYRERLVRRSKGFTWAEPVHEHLVIGGVTRNFDVAITHGEKERSHSTRNLDIYEKRRQQGLPFSPRATYYYARELRTHGRLDDAILQYNTFLSTPGIWQEDAIWACADLADCFTATGRREEALAALFASFTRDLPRAEVLCRIGSIYMDNGDAQKAVYWYNLALDAPKPDGWGFISREYWDFIPHMQLCVLHANAGNREQAIAHHEAAKAIKPSDPRVLHNQAFFYGNK